MSPSESVRLLLLEGGPTPRHRTFTFGEQGAALAPHVTAVHHPPDGPPGAPLASPSPGSRALASARATNQRPAIEEALSELREVLSGPEGRQALRALLGGERLKVAPDEERGFRVGGVVRVGPDMLVAGERFATDETGRVPVMPYRLRS